MNSLKPVSVLFITHTPVELQGQRLLEALSDFGAAVAVSPEEAFPQLHRRTFDLILLDAGAVADPPELILRLLAGRPEAAIAVMTVSPAWKHARAVLQAGALDYVKMSLDPDDLRHTLAGVIERLPGQA